MLARGREYLTHTISTRSLSAAYKKIITSHKRVLEIGCGEGHVLASLQPAHGLGIESSTALVQNARANYNWIAFDTALPRQGSFDYVVVSGVPNAMQWPDQALDWIERLCHAESRIIVATPTRWAKLLYWVFTLVTFRGAPRPTMPRLMSPAHMAAFSASPKIQVINTTKEFVNVSSLGWFGELCIFLLTKIWALRRLTQFFVTTARFARPVVDARASVSVIIPVKNEAGNVEELYNRVPQMGRATECIFIEGGSSDDTVGQLAQVQLRAKKIPVVFLRQTGTGKKDAVRLGFSMAKGEVLIILDGDLTISPEDLCLFYDSLVTGKGEVINGTRFAYRMAPGAMRPFNRMANLLFARLISIMLGQQVGDCLCGTKVMTRHTYRQLLSVDGIWTEGDPFGDFDLLFAAGKVNLKISDVPVKYFPRRYGKTNIRRWQDGLALVRYIAARFSSDLCSHKLRSFQLVQEKKSIPDLFIAYVGNRGVR